MTAIIAPEPMRVQQTAEVVDYVVAHSTAPDQIQLDLIARTKELFGQQAGMSVAPEQGTFIGLLARLVNAKNAVEVGTFTGYSSLCIARALPADGHLLCCDISEEWTALAREAWEKAGVADRVELRIGSALDTLRALPHEEYIDLAFVDADKVGYAAYYEELLPRLRPGGLLLFDNVLFAGKVLRDATEPNPAALREFNRRLADDDRVEVSMLPIADGVTLARKH